MHLIACAVTLIVVSLTTSNVSAALKAGAAKRSIVPPFPTQMGGYTDRLVNFEGVHDEIFARAVALENESTAVIVIGADLMSVDKELVRLAREEITAETRIPPSNILICAAHNHSAPSYYQKSAIGKEDEEPSLKKFLAKQFAEAAVEAYRARVPARAGFAAGELKGMTRNRQQGNDLVDPQVGVLRVETLEGRTTIATLFNFTGHPVVLNSLNLNLSGEFPGAASRAVENLLGGVAIFTQGACGDITVHRSGDPFQEIERIGRTIAGEVIKTSGFIACSDSAPLAASAKTLQLDARLIPPLAEAKEMLAKGQTDLENAKKAQAAPPIIERLERRMPILEVAVKRAEAIEKDPSKKEEHVEVEVQAVRIGDCVYVAIPGELFVEYALELRSRIKQQTGLATCLVGYANGYIGYIVTPRAMETGGYEASITRIQTPGGRTMVETAMELVPAVTTE